MTTYTQLELFERKYPAAPGWDALCLREDLRLHADRLAPLAAAVVTVLAAAWDKLLWPLAKAGFAKAVHWLDRELTQRPTPAAAATRLKPHPITHPAPRPAEVLYPPSRAEFRASLLELARADLQKAAGTKRNISKAALVDMILNQRQQ